MTLKTKNSAHFFESNFIQLATITKLSFLLKLFGGLYPKINLN